MKNIPFVPIPIQIMKNLTKNFLSIGDFLLKLIPGFEVTLLRADIELDEREYITISFFSSLFWTFMVTMSLFLLNVFRTLPISFFFIGPPLTFFVIFSYIKSYPKLIISRKIKDIERNLLFALRSMEIQVSSGINLFDSIASVSKGNFGLISEEFKTAVKKITTGKPEMEALEELILRNPSLYFRRIIWQITNSLRSGTDLSSTLKVIVGDLSYEKLVSIRKYGSQLNPMAMMYMMVAVIFPTLGVSLLMILSSFSSMQLSEVVFWMILGTTAFLQFIFIGMIKSKRPVVD
ncbi:MAG: hypothetical protein GF368_01270 [Candidatus Aenigmarchaeota archaeon]|nr:hypothetical protein [Candidatus Aenigmarchaeota archaeon]